MRSRATPLLLYFILSSVLFLGINIPPSNASEDSVESTSAGEDRYPEGLNFIVSAQGVAVSKSGGEDQDASMTMTLAVNRTHGPIVYMDLVHGAGILGNDEVRLHSGKAYYLIPFHQLRFFGNVEDSPTVGSDATFKLSAIVANVGPLPTNSSDGAINVKFVGPPSRIGADWNLKMDGQLTVALTSKTLQDEQITLTAILNDNGDTERFHLLLNSALEKLRDRHPDLDIQIVERQYPYPEARTQLISAVSNQIPADIVSIDQIWLGELAEMGTLTDLTDYAAEWGRSEDWYSSNWDGGAYKGRTYALWIWTDVRGMYYWEDMLREADVEPASLQTWDGYLSAAKKLNEKLRPQGIEGVHLTGVGHSPDLWYPYLWMLGGEIVEQRGGHPAKGVYWFPAYNSTEGIEALSFIKHQLESGIVPQTEHHWGQEFHDRKFAVMTEASHVPGYFLEGPQSLDKVGFIPMFPVPNDSVQTTTLMGGWELGVPSTSNHKELSWELITLMAEPEILAPWLARYNYLPTQLPIGEGHYAEQLAETNPFFSEMASEIQYGRSRPSIPEYPAIAEHIREAINAAYFGDKDPKEALDEAAQKSAVALGWLNDTSQ